MSDAMVRALQKRDTIVRERTITAPVVVLGGVYYWRGFTSPKGSVKRPAPMSGTSHGGVTSSTGGQSRGRGGGGHGRGFGGSFGGGTKGRATPYDRSTKK